MLGLSDSWIGDVFADKWLMRFFVGGFGGWDGFCFRIGIFGSFFTVCVSYLDFFCFSDLCRGLLVFGLLRLLCGMGLG